MNNRTLSDTRADESSGLAFRAEDGGDRISTSLADDDDNLSFAILIAGISAVAAIFFLVGWLYVTSKIAAIDLSNLASPPTTRPFISSAIASRSLCSNPSANMARTNQRWVHPA
jgi:hypothetical protein